MGKTTNFTKQQLVKIQSFLTDVLETNEDTAYDPDQEYIVNDIIELTREQSKTSIAEDFSIPYVHPMITVQKWSSELKLMVEDLLNTDYL